MIKKKTMKTSQKKAEIDYPCQWEYKVIGENQDLIQDALITSCGPDKPLITYSHTSSGGKYHSFSAKIQVKDEKSRLSIFEKLHCHSAILMVI